MKGNANRGHNDLIGITGLFFAPVIYLGTPEHSMLKSLGPGNEPLTSASAYHRIISSCVADDHKNTCLVSSNIEKSSITFLCRWLE